MTEVEILKEEVTRLRLEMNAILRVLWDERGLAKSLSGRIEKELEVAFKDMLERGKISET